MVTVGLLVRIEARTGHEMDVENMLRDALTLVDEEQETITWFAMRLGPATFAIFDAFPDDSGRQKHLDGRVAAALQEHADWFTQDPTIEPVDILAAKLAAVAAVKTAEEQPEPPPGSRFLVGERRAGDRS